MKKKIFSNVPNIEEGYCTKTKSTTRTQQHKVDNDTVFPVFHLNDIPVETRPLHIFSSSPTSTVQTRNANPKKGDISTSDLECRPVSQLCITPISTRFR